MQWSPSPICPLWSALHAHLLQLWLAPLPWVQLAVHGSFRNLCVRDTPQNPFLESTHPCLETTLPSHRLLLSGPSSVTTHITETSLASSHGSPLFSDSSAPTFLLVLWSLTQKLKVRGHTLLCPPSDHFHCCAVGF